MKYTLILLSVVGSWTTFAQALSEEKTELIGKISDIRSRLPVDGDVAIFHNSDFIKDDSCNSKNGEFSLSLNKAGWYLISVSAPGYREATDTVWIMNTSRRQITREFFMSASDIEPRLATSEAFDDIYFEPGGHTLTGQSINELEKAVNFLKSKPGVVIDVAGHSDGDGGADYNLLLSRKRAETVAAYLADHGIDARQLIMSNYGASKPISLSEPGRWRNRRVEISLLALGLTTENPLSLPANIYFLPGKHFLTEEATSELDNAVTFFKSNSIVAFEIGGHTDSDGTTRDNLILSQLRAQTVVSYLVEHGVNQFQLVAHGYGESNPIDLSNAPEGKAKNRRVEFRPVKTKLDGIAQNALTTPPNR
jgi:outer membrane protein OmpA-like peptidoglycan-associated protein